VLFQLAISDFHFFGLTSGGAQPSQTKGLSERMPLMAVTSPPVLCLRLCPAEAVVTGSLLLTMIQRFFNDTKVLYTLFLVVSKRHAYDLGLVGNCAYLAYVGKNTNIRWLCWPRFDSSFVFGDLLDDEKGGHFSILPTNGITSSEQHYIENTNVLATTVTAPDGVYRVTDYAPRFSQYGRYFKPLMLVRKIEKISGNPSVIVRCEPKGDYGNITPNVSFGSNHIRYRGLEDQLRLTTNIPLNYVTNLQPFTLTETKYLILTFGVPLEAPIEETAEKFLHQTIDYWRVWVEHCNIPNIFQKSVVRSGLVLKLHQYEDTGAIIASGTTSLPESPGSGRNWDYRYFWVRDTYYTLNAFNQLGHFQELDSYSHFLQNIVANNSNLGQPVYSISGAKDLTEKTLDLKGYLGNSPVRLGNAAYKQVQNDVYGQILLSLLPLYIDERMISQRRLSNFDLIYKLLGCIEQTMDTPDAGLWEFRGMSRKHCYTFLFHWAGASAAQKIATAFQKNELVDYARKLKAMAAEQIEKCYNPKLKCYTSAVGLEDLDASLFQLVTMQYLGQNTERASEHVEALRKGLSADGEGLFYRYLHVDDFGKPDVAFLVCGFWYVSALVATGKIDEALSTYERLLGFSNHVGLYSEDIDPKTKSQWGNFVQTYSHVGLINAAFDIDRKLNKPLFL